MAFKSVFSPELRGKLAEKQRYLATAQKAVSQFARFPGPDGRYYFRLAKVTAGTDRKTGGYKFNFKFICVASVESRSPEFAGSPMNITFRCSPSLKMKISSAAAGRFDPQPRLRWLLTVIE